MKVENLTEEEHNQPEVVEQPKQKAEIHSLYIRAAKWLKKRDTAEAKLTEICPLITAVKFPRQKAADFAHVHFKCAEDKDEAYGVLKKHPEVTVQPNRRDNPKAVEKVVQKNKERKRAKEELKTMIKRTEKAERDLVITDRIFLKGLPIKMNEAELKIEFPEAINFRFQSENGKNPGTRNVIIKFPTPKEALIYNKQTFSMQGQNVSAFLYFSRAQKKNLTKNNIGRSNDLRAKAPKKENVQEKNTQKKAVSVAKKSEKKTKAKNPTSGKETKKTLQKTNKSKPEFSKTQKAPLIKRKKTTKAN